MDTYVAATHVPQESKSVRFVDHQFRTGCEVTFHKKPAAMVWKIGKSINIHISIVYRNVKDSDFIMRLKKRNSSQKIL